ncbi:CpaF family protein [Magnetospira sp. QH-2]|uniref:CpaF family protein n=1 Tax=Magnetospira sp. (strain QH-2) TaxID=1288970 RepID=UPI0003E81461|nr:CpaF family protein [Magnetospira sp. QH-2]CCQ73553.1 Putative type II/IV secretion system protein. Pilus assembly protein CpaF cpaF [Magnetospira sp. QH-2]
MFGRRGQTDKVVPLRPEPDAPVLQMPPASADARDTRIEQAIEKVLPRLRQRLDLEDVGDMPRGKLANMVTIVLEGETSEDPLEQDEIRDAVTVLINLVLAETAKKNPAPVEAGPDPVGDVKEKVQLLLLEKMDVGKAAELPRDELAAQVGEIVGEILGEQKIQLNTMETRDLVTLLLNDMLGLGPLEPLLADEAITDIMVNGPKQVYVERGGKLVLSEVTFRDDAHVMNVASRIVSLIGRRVDESSPICDARLADGSRVNIIIPPLAIDGPSISIRKFAKQKITLEVMEKNNNLSPSMGTVLRIASRSRLNILISGGTGSGKTTLLNALSRLIDHGERVVTIEDAAELQLQQPHVVRLETRPPNLEGSGEINQRDLVKNCLRMRPDRIILGEIRAGEALDMLQAMNTGHDGSLGTIHANNPREALTRLENMVAMTGVKLPHEAVRSQIASAVHLVVQVSRMRDGVRRITQITEVVGMEGEVITTQDLFTFVYEGEDGDGKLFGTYQSSGLRPHFLQKAKYFGLDRALMEAMG